MAIDKLCPIRGGRWITMDSRPLNIRPISFCRTIIDSHQDPIVFAINQIYHNFKQDRRYYFSFSANRADEVVERFISLGDTSRPEPTGDGFSAFGKDDSGEDYSQSPGRALMQAGGQFCQPCCPFTGKDKFRFHFGSPYQFCIFNRHIGKDEPFLLQYQFIKELN
jgi:hypothetical protein